METTNTISNLEEKVHKVAIRYTIEVREGFKIVDDTPEGFELVACDEPYWDDQPNTVVFVSSNMTKPGKSGKELNALALQWLDEHSEFDQSKTLIRHDFVNVAIWDDTTKASVRYRKNMFID